MKIKPNDKKSLIAKKKGEYLFEFERAEMFPFRAMLYFNDLADVYDFLEEIAKEIDNGK